MSVYIYIIHMYISLYFIYLCIFKVLLLGNVWLEFFFNKLDLYFLLFTHFSWIFSRFENVINYWVVEPDTVT